MALGETPAVGWDTEGVRRKIRPAGGFYRKALALGGALLIGAGVWAGLSRAAMRVALPPQVGHMSAKGLMVATGQFIQPDGPMVVFDARPMDLAVSHDGQFAYLKDSDGLTVVDCRGMKMVQHVKVAGGSSFWGLVLSQDGKTLCYSTATDKIVVFDVLGGRVSQRKAITLPAAGVGGNPNPCGMTFQDPDHIFVCLNRDNSVGRVDLNTGDVEKWACDVAPFDVAYLPEHQRLYVSCWARQAEGKERRALSSGTNVPVDERGVGLGGRLDLIDLGLAAEPSSRAPSPIPIRSAHTPAAAEPSPPAPSPIPIRSAHTPGAAEPSPPAPSPFSGEKGEGVGRPIGLEATQVLLAGNQVFVPCSGSDTVERFSTDGVFHQTIQLFPNQPVGAAPESVALAPNCRIAYVACSGRNTVLVYDLDESKPLGEYRTAWYPTSLRLSNGKLYVACGKGIGELAKEKNPHSHNSYDFTGALCVIDTNKKPRQIEGVSSTFPRSGIAAVPVPARSGEPSLIKHVVYVIRENRTYDQLFGDMKEGDGDSSLCNFGEKVTPNAHALAREYALLDNYYCNGVNSADGHSWATEGNATTNLERSFNAWTRSYPFGDDALNTSSTGFLWDEVLEAHERFINFGEFDYASTAKGESYFDCLKEHYAGRDKIKFKRNIGVERMRDYAAPGYPGWDLSIPDVLRADIFCKALNAMPAHGGLPDLTVLYLCCDHTGGPVTAKAQVADNDLATGMCVQAITHSPYWKDTCIFVEEDDPQAGWDHVDGHRSICLVISPYSRGLGRIDDFYNQTSAYRTMEQILGLQTKSMFSAISPIMFSCFRGHFDPTPYTAQPNQIPLDETTAKNYGTNFDLSKPDLVDDRKFNRAIWAQTMPGKPYPAEFEGAHGKGLSARGLALSAFPPGQAPSEPGEGR